MNICVSKAWFSKEILLAISQILSGIAYRGIAYRKEMRVLICFMAYFFHKIFMLKVALSCFNRCQSLHTSNFLSHCNQKFTQTETHKILLRENLNFELQVVGRKKIRSMECLAQISKLNQDKVFFKIFDTMDPFVTHTSFCFALMILYS